MSGSEESAGPRVLFLASTFRRGGAERIVVETAVGLQRRHAFRCRAIFLKEEGALGRELKARGIETEARLIEGRIDPLGFLRLRRAIANQRADVLYMLDHRNAVAYGVPASLAAGVRRRVMAVHTMGLPGGRRSVPASVRAMLPWIDAVVTVAEGQRRYLQDREGIPRDKMELVPNGVDVERFRPPAGDAERIEARRALGLPESGPLIATLSVLRPEKGHEIFIKAVGSIHRALPDASFVVLGEGPERERLERIAAENGLDSRIVFAGWISDTATALRAVDVIVFTSRPVVETAPLAALEAMAAGVPVIASDVGALRELVEEGVSGYLVPPGDWEAIADRMRRLASDAGARARMSEAARRSVEESFRLDASVAASAALLRRLAGSERIVSREA